MLELTPGRSPKGFGWPLGCCGRGGAIEICSAQLSTSQRCMLCQRGGSFPAPTAWPGDLEIEGLAGPSAQAVQTSLPSLPWAAIVLLYGRWVDPRWPVVGARSAREAVQITLARAAQVWPGSTMEPTGPGTWRAGRGVVLAQRAHAATEGTEG